MNLKTLLFLAAASFLTWHPMPANGDNVPPSDKPPKNLATNNVPQFIVLGFDDQMTKDGMQNVLDAAKGRKNPAGKGQSATQDGTPVRFTFYTASTYLTQSKELHAAAVKDGHEIGNHTNSHTTNFKTTESSWQSEISKCTNDLVSAGVVKEQIVGFRTPYLQYNNATFSTIKSMGFLYDCSIEEGWDPAHDGTNFLWPYTLDNGSPGNKIMVDWKDEKLPYELIKSYPGLWEMPCYTILIPPDSLCEKYSLSKRLRYRIKMYSHAMEYFDTTNGKITGLDYNLFWGADLDGIEIGKVLCYNLDLHYNSNRTPFNYGTHSNYYITNGGPSNMITKGLEGLKYFLDYALTKPDVRIVPALDVVRWMQNPVALDPNKTGNVKSPHANPAAASMAINAITTSGLDFVADHVGHYSLALMGVDGKTLYKSEFHLSSGGNHHISLPSGTLASRKVVIVHVDSGSDAAQRLLVVR